MKKSVILLGMVVCFFALSCQGQPSVVDVPQTNVNVSKTSVDVPKTSIEKMKDLISEITLEPEEGEDITEYIYYGTSEPVYGDDGDEVVNYSVYEYALNTYTSEVESGGTVFEFHYADEPDHPFLSIWEDLQEGPYNVAIVIFESNTYYELYIL
jgi:hypothetical protein